MRLIPAAWLLAAAVLGAATGAAAQVEAPQWSLKVWPGQASILETQEIADRTVIRRTIQCTNGVREVVSRRFLIAGDRDPAGAQPCGSYCRTRLSQTLPRGAVIPDRYKEDRLPIRTLRRVLAAELAAEVAAEPWRERDNARLDLLVQMADACRLPLPVTLGDGRWSPISAAAIVGGPAMPTIYALAPRTRTGRPVTRPTSPGSITEPLILRIVAEVPKGAAAVSLRDAGGKLIGAEALLAATDGQAAIYFELRPDTPPASISVRNNDPDAEASALLVRRIDVMPKARLEKDDLVDLTAATRAQAMGRPYLDAPTPPR